MPLMYVTRGFRPQLLAESHPAVDNNNNSSFAHDSFDRRVSYLYTNNQW